MFVDEASGYLHLEFQTILNSHQTLKAKEAFERIARDHGVVVLKYLSDNGTAFTSHKYSRRLLDFKQVQRFACVGAHHHNGIAECGQFKPSCRLVEQCLCTAPSTGPTCPTQLCGRWQSSMLCSFGITCLIQSPAFVQLTSSAEVGGPSLSSTISMYSVAPSMFSRKVSLTERRSLGGRRSPIAACT